jgi:hypothetical protein
LIQWRALHGSDNGVRRRRRNGGGLYPLGFQRRMPWSATEARAFPSAKNPPKHRSGYHDNDRDHHAPAGQDRLLRRRRVRHWQARRQFIQSALEFRQRLILVGEDGSRERSYLGTSVKTSRDCCDVLLLERLEMASRDLRFTRDLLQCQATAFARAPQELAEARVVDLLSGSWPA